MRLLLTNYTFSTLYEIVVSYIPPDIILLCISVKQQGKGALTICTTLMKNCN